MTALVEAIAAPAETAARIDAALAAKPEGVIEAIAAEAGVRYRDVLARLPAGDAVLAPGAVFEAVWQELTGWGPVLVIVHTAAGVFEIDTALSPGTFGRGYFNITGNAPLHGHLAAARCTDIAFVDRPFFGRRSCSIQFVDTDGDCMFKVFVRRGADRSLDAVQTERFEALRARMTAAAAG